MATTSRQPRRQRRALFTADTFHRRKLMAVPLSRELRSRFGRRQLPVRKGDTVRILSGSYVGREERVAKVDRRELSVTLDNVTGKKADQKLKPLPIRTHHLLLTRLNLADPWRRRILKVTTVPEEEEGEAVPEAAPETASRPAAETATEEGAPGEKTDAGEESPPADEEKAEAAPKRRSSGGGRSRAAAKAKEEEA